MMPLNKRLVKLISLWFPYFSMIDLLNDVCMSCLLIVFYLFLDWIDKNMHIPR